MISRQLRALAISCIVLDSLLGVTGASAQEAEKDHPAPTHALVLADGTRVSGHLQGVDKGRLTFRSEDGRELSHDASEIAAVIPAGGDVAAARAAPETGGIRFEKAVVPGAILRYRAGSPYVMHVHGARPHVTVVETHDPIVLLHPGPAGAFTDLELDEKFARETLRAMGELGRKDPPSAVRLGHDYLEIAGPSGGRMTSRIQEAIARLRASWERKAPDLFRIPGVTVYRYEDRRFLIYDIRSKIDSFDGLECRVWAQLRDGTVYSSRFIYYTVRRGQAHTDYVEPWEHKGEVAHWRIQLFAHGVLVATRESKPAGPEGWWNAERVLEFSSWGLTRRGPDRYSTRSLGKKGVDYVPRDSLTSTPRG